MLEFFKQDPVKDFLIKNDTIKCIYCMRVVFIS